MIKIDKLELFRVFVVLEAALVGVPGIPIIMYWFGSGLLYLIDCGEVEVLAFLGLCFTVTFFLSMGWFLLAGGIVSGLVKFLVPSFSPGGVSIGLLGAGVYSVIALVFALPVSIRTPLRRRRRLSAECVAAAGGGKAPKADEAKVGDKTDGAT